MNHHTIIVLWCSGAYMAVMYTIIWLAEDSYKTWWRAFFFSSLWLLWLLLLVLTALTDGVSRALSQREKKD